jgi:hypothetical protein
MYLVETRPLMLPAVTIPKTIKSQISEIGKDGKNNNRDGSIDEEY